MRQDGDKGNERKETGRRRLAKEAYFIDIVFFFLSDKGIRANPSSYPDRWARAARWTVHVQARRAAAVQPVCSVSVLVLSCPVLGWAGRCWSWSLAGDLASVVSTDPVQCLLASVVGPAQALNVGRPKRGRRRRQDQKRRRGRKKRVAGGVGVGSGCDETTRSKKNGKKATSE